MKYYLITVEAKSTGKKYMYAARGRFVEIAEELRRGGGVILFVRKFTKDEYEKYWRNEDD